MSRALLEPKKPKRTRRVCPSEASEQQLVVTALNRAGVRYFHVPNERRDESTRISLAAMGVQPGVPDLVIIDPPPKLSAPGAVIEMKRREGGRVSKNQEKWLDYFAERGWATAVCEGHKEALVMLKKWGYLVR